MTHWQLTILKSTSRKRASSWRGERTKSREKNGDERVQPKNKDKSGKQPPLVVCVLYNVLYNATISSLWKSAQAALLKDNQLMKTSAKKDR